MLYWSQYFVYTTTRSGRITANTTNWRVAQNQRVGQAWWNYVCQYSPVYIYNVHSICKFFIIIKVYWPNLDWVGHEKYFVRLDGLWNFYLHPKMGHQIVPWILDYHKKFPSKKLAKHRENGYYSKKMWNFVFNYNKNDLHHQKAYKKPNIRHSNSFLILQIVFELLLF
jgi:hypothetical protein